MNRRLVVGTMVMAAAIFAVQAASAEVAVPAPLHAIYSHVKMVSFSVRNDSKEPIKVKAGDSEVTLQPGKLVPLKLEAGTKIVAEEATPTFAAGELITVVSNELSDSTLVLK
jgi:hypothetical protein